LIALATALALETKSASFHPNLTEMEIQQNILRAREERDTRLIIS